MQFAAVANTIQITRNFSFRSRKDMTKARLNADILPTAHRNLKMMATMKGVTMVTFLNELFTTHAPGIARQTLGSGHDELIDTVFAAPDAGTGDRREIANG